MPSPCWRWRRIPALPLCRTGRTSPSSSFSVMGLRQVPGIGHVSAERKQGDHAYALFDRMPPGTVMAMTMVITPQDMVLHHLERIEHAAFGDSAEAELAKHEAHAAKREVAQGNK